LLARYAPRAVADAFVDTRVLAVPSVLGTLPPGVDADAIVSRATPAVD
jgi:hypothetical protein